MSYFSYLSTSALRKDWHFIIVRLILLCFSFMYIHTVPLIEFRPFLESSLAISTHTLFSYPHLEVIPEHGFDSHTSNTTANHSPQPRVLRLGRARPEAVLVLAVLLKLRKLDWVRSGVPALLRSLGRRSAADESKEDVVGDGPEE